MPLNETSFEKLGAFYLGRPYDMETRTAADEPVLYDSRDLLTHAVCVGMTGSGKTGLCLALLEEAAIDGVPAIVIDPKGDLGNLLLTFPGLQPSDFRPWINEDDAARKNLTPDEHAAAQAQLWRDGLARWGQGPDRITRLRESAEMTIYTPGSSSGVPVNIFASFQAPDDGTDTEAVAGRAQTAAAGLLGLMKSSADPARSREGILISTILTAAWQSGTDLDLPALAALIQRPPFDKVGLLDLETFFPAKDRFDLVMALNTVLAAPSFATWREGDPLDIARMLYTPEGRPRVAIFSIAHLGDSERMFFVSLLLNEVLAWTRAQAGTTSLRALVYMDEIFGYLPPTANPPSKLPLLTLLKQARAFGVGIVLATQNPVDLDYKALSNAGTWFIGRLQTERDKARMLDGLQGASAGGSFDRARMESLLGGLGNRIFLLNNVHSDGPRVFETRWAMSYLRGPLTREQIRSLTRDNRTPTSTSPGRPDTQPPSAQAAATAGLRPTVPPGLPEVFFPGPAGTTYVPALLVSADVTYRDAKLGYESQQRVAFLTGFPGTNADPDWDAAEATGTNPSILAHEPATGASFSDPPSAATRPANYPLWEKSFRTWAGSHLTIEIPFCRDPKAVAAPGEDPADFHARLHQLARESRDASVDTLRKKFAPRQSTLQARLQRAESALAKQKEQATHARVQTMITVGSSILGAFFGRKTLSSQNIGRVATASRGISRTLREGSDVTTSAHSVEAVQAQIAELEEELCTALAELTARTPLVETATLKPARTGITTLRASLAWIPTT